jgi:ElaB/YqjD/DUF883 family membrane-anchored ribosome-binding protein
MPANNLSNNLADSTTHMADQAAASADSAIKTTQRATNNAFDSLAGGVQDLRNQAAPLIARASSQASDLTQRGADTVRETTQQLRERALRASDSTVNYIREEPVKSMLIAAATGAGLMALLSLMTRSNDRN